MTPKLMIEPSYWLGTGIKLEKIDNLNLFKFTDEMQARSDELLKRSKSGLIKPEEQAELDGISELAHIFTYANSILVAESKWFPTPSEKLSEEDLKKNHVRN
ncbi:hypothetical protein WA1_31145 [Scytonema hofmannii PCC 7110]|uniref:Uncharacterized protein n=1 Tax=Scytonema hofmannii PCC 7110 TaxID=128403 RepID=A0A139X3D8_9CYAN|nr:hypothetical protein [Scytonema hofmannii]KYC39205.1 hypothetical protein WA1_31145 [Scytonema hofmannii PCC 7110]